MSCEQQVDGRAPGRARSDHELLKFAQQLLTNPVGDVPLRISGRPGADDSFEEHVGLTVALGLRGQVAVVAHLATPTRLESNAGSSRREARVEVLTPYGALQRFSSGLSGPVVGTAEQARPEAVVPV